MSNPAKQLLEAFQRDHATLGRGLHDLATALRGSDILTAKRIAALLDHDAGSHIAFEERHFYPRLRPLIGDEHVDRFYAEHRAGQAAIRAILAMPDAAWPDRQRSKAVLQDVELMERHIAECGEMFGAMGRIPAEEQVVLLEQLNALRGNTVCWTWLEPVEPNK